MMGILAFSTSKLMWASDIKNHKNSIKGLRRLSVSKTSLSVDVGLGAALPPALPACFTGQSTLISHQHRLARLF